MRKSTIFVGLLLASTHILSASALDFTAIDAAFSDEAKRMAIASPSININGKDYAIGYNVLARTGDKLGEGIFGLLVDAKGDAVVGGDGEPEISVDADFTTLLPVGDKLFSVTHFESRPGAMYVSEVEQNKETGELKYISTKPVDFSAFGGLWVPCAGSVTPWGTHLGSEEYPPNVRGIEDAQSLDDIDDYFKPFARYFGLNPDTMSLEDFRGVFSPYQYGYATEITVTADGNATAAKHYALGRSAFELAYVMPDQRTVFFSDDGTNVGLYMFIADEAGKLDAGTTYAAKWNQTSKAGGGSANIDWISLGHATSDEVKAYIDNGTKFYDIFDIADVAENGTCADGFSPINTSDGAECLQIKKGMEVAASRLETRRYAALKGATTEFRKEEGITFAPEYNKLFVAMSEVAKGMEDASKNDIAGYNDIRLDKNACGAVYELDVRPNASIGSDYVPTNMNALIAGRPYEYAEDFIWAGNSCFIDGISNPDNITWIAGNDTLIIGEDTGSGHQNDVIWSMNYPTKQLTRIFSTPYGSETTSPYIYTNINGFGYLMAVIQHPYGESDEDKLNNPTDAQAYVGYVGPLPALSE